MKITTEQAEGVVVLRLGGPRLVYAVLEAFLDGIRPHLDVAAPRFLLDMREVNYVDSAAIGCLMDLYRRASEKQGRIGMFGVQERVHTMLRMTGTHEFIPMLATRDEGMAEVRENVSNG